MKTQNIKNTLINSDSDIINKKEVLDALYLDFVNIFLDLTKLLRKGEKTKLSSIDKQIEDISGNFSENRTN
jgi:hypothetical protein